MAQHLKTQLVGSWSRPHWLASASIRDAVGPAEDFWRVAPEYLREAQDDATRLAIFDQQVLGLDVITDGEERRQLFDRYIYGRLSGVDAEHPVEHTWGGPAAGPQGWRKVVDDIGSQAGPPRVPSPRVVGPVTWPGPLTVRDFEILDGVVKGRQATKMTLSGPVTALNRLADEYYHDRRALGLDLAAALNQEAHALADAGCRIIQLDEPEFRTAHRTRAEESREFINRAVAGLRERGVSTYAHMCYGYANAISNKSVNPEFRQALEVMASTDIDAVSIEYTQPGHTPEVLKALGDKEILLGVINCDPASAIETPDEVADRIRAALSVVPFERLGVAPDCGVWFLPRKVALAKVHALVEGARMVREAL